MTKDVFNREFSISPIVFEIVPQYRRYVILASGAGSKPISPSLAERFNRAVQSAQSRVKLENLAEDPHIAPWREAFRAAGWSPAKFRSSIEALLRRALRSELQPLNNSLVDCGTIATLEHLVPIGVHVLDGLPADAQLELARADGNERFELFDGTIESPDPGEIVYKCGDLILTRRWAWRQGRVGSVEPGSESLAVNVDIIDPDTVVPDDVVSGVVSLLEACDFHIVNTLMIDSISHSAKN